MTYELIAPCHFGLESVLKKEITDLGYEILLVEDGRVTFCCDEEGIARSNMFLRTCERVYIKAGQFHAETFDDLFEGIRAIDWKELIPKDGRFWVKKARSVKSRLFSPSDIQSIVKKAIVEKLKETYRTDWFEESGDDYPLWVFIHKDEVLVGIDTTGESLHKRGYREVASEAPISETLASALILLTPWNRNRILVDPFCGSGTICIEAAMMAAHMAPGINREFLCQDWEHLIPKKIWYHVIEEANDLVDLSVETDIQGYDIDPKVVRIARENAQKAGVGDLIHFQQREVRQLSHPKKYGFLITNPPYGERLEDQETLPGIYRDFGERFRALDSWSAFFITSYEDAQRYFGGKASKNRKIYNGMIKTYFYSYLGPKPKK
ncbi:MAG: class I SAM-dependent RNA methyltransferase [Parasporobacterium sp.]|nr:class I SAM-dependent RNA methyltransferase [Parasporobacterium sp.]